MFMLVTTLHRVPYIGKGAPSNEKDAVFYPKQFPFCLCCLFMFMFVTTLHRVPYIGKRTPLNGKDAVSFHPARNLRFCLCYVVYVYVCYYFA